MTWADVATSFMIAVCDTPACSLRRKVHADVSQTLIMRQVGRRASTVRPPHDPRTPAHDAAAGKPHGRLEFAT